VPTVLITSGTSFTVPPDFSSLVAIEAIGAGASGVAGSNAGKGGNYAKITALAGIAASNVYSVQIGVGGGTTGAGTTPTANTWFNNGSTLVAAGGDDTTTNSVGSTKFAGGTTSGTTAGGGGAGGPNGTGLPNSSTTGGSGDFGTGGAGGAGGIPNGNPGSPGTEMAGGVGAGGGGGGSHGGVGIGGAGGNYGGGGGGAASGTGGTGAPGIILFSYNATGGGTTVNLVGAAAAGAAGTVTPSISGGGTTTANLVGAAAAGVAGTIAVVGSVARPTFVGTFDKRDPNEYFQAVPSSAFDEAQLGTWDRNWHKAGATFTLAAIVYVNGSPVIAGNANGSSAAIGWSWTINVLNPNIIRGNGSSRDVQQTTLAVVNNAWNFIAVAVSEAGGAGASHHRIGGLTTTFNAHLASPTTSNSPNLARISGYTDGTFFFPSGFRIMMLMAWNRALSQAETWRLYRRWQTERMTGLI
jgi:hypothetical protein